MTDPKRLLEQPGSDLDVLLLESALDEAPPSRAVDRTLVALGVASATTGLCAGAATTTAATIKSGAAGGGLGAVGWFSSLSLVGKLGMGIAFVGAAVGAPYAVLHDSEPGEPASSPAVIAPQGEGETKPSDSSAPASEAAPGDQARATTPAEQLPADQLPAEKAASEKPAAEQPATDKGSSQEAAPPSASPPKATGEKPAASKPAAEPKAGASSLREEVRLLDAARGALRNGDKAAARGHLDTYAARFPNGQMKAEAQAMRAFAKE